MTAPATALEGCWTKARWLAEPATLVRLKTAGAAVPGALAVTWKEPTWELAVTEIAATPLLPVVTVGGSRERDARAGGRRGEGDRDAGNAVAQRVLHADLELAGIVGGDGGRLAVAGHDGDAGGSPGADDERGAADGERVPSVACSV